MAAGQRVELPSKSQINRSGKYLQQFEGPEETWPENFDESKANEAIEVVSAFRAAHAQPMQKVRMGLLSMLQKSSAQVAVTQRLKRVPRIIRKLYRMESSMLARLGDIGGVRAVVADFEELDRVYARIVERWEPHFVRTPIDYVARPKPMGYRAIHIVVRRDDRAIEVQLRTTGQQEWADAVERMDSLRGLNLKDGDGPDSLMRYFAAAGELIHLREVGLELNERQRVEFIAARDAVVAQGFYRR